MVGGRSSEYAIAYAVPRCYALTMLTDYIRAAMSQAHYELLEDRTFYGEIQGLQGVLANAVTLEACRDELQEVLEEWIILGLRLGHALPTVGGIQLSAALENA